MIQILILIGISLLVLLAFEGPLLAKLLSKEKQQNCEATIAVHKATKLFYDLASSPVPIKCPRTETTFYEDHLETDKKTTPIIITENNNKKLITKYEFLNENIINPILAEQLRNCWKNFGEGEGSSPFNRETGELQRICAICSQIEFKTANINYNIESLKTYLKKETIPYSEKTYYEYLNKQNIISVVEIAGEPYKKVTANSLTLFPIDFKQNDYYYIMLMNKVPSPIGKGWEKVMNFFSYITVKEDEYDNFYLYLINDELMQENVGQCNQIIG